MVNIPPIRMLYMKSMKERTNSLSIINKLIHATRASIPNNTTPAQNKIPVRGTTYFCVICQDTFQAFRIPMSGKFFTSHRIQYKKIIRTRNKNTQIIPTASNIIHHIVSYI